MRSRRCPSARALRQQLAGAGRIRTITEFDWPSKLDLVRDAYEAAMDKVEDRHVRELKEFAKNYNNLTDDAAKKKLDEVLAISQARLDVQKEFVPQFRAVVSQVKVTRS